MTQLNFKTLKIFGKEAAGFLQNFTTCDINNLPETPVFAAACNQKGRIIANFWIQRDLTGFLLQLPESLLAKLEQHFKKFVFRSEVNFETRNEPGFNLPDRFVIWITPKTTEMLIPQMIAMEKHGGISFNKGCYLGQEIIARTQHLGKLKRHLYEFNLPDKITPEIGDDIITAQHQKVGMIVAIDGQKIFAVVEDRAITIDLYWQAKLLTKLMGSPCAPV